MDVNDWDVCKQCGVTGPDVRKGSCAPCRGEKLPKKRSQKAYWDARSEYHQDWIQLREAEQAMEEAKEELSEAREAVDHSGSRVIKEETKLAGGLPWGCMPSGNRKKQ